MWTLKVDWITAPVLVIQVGRINENTPVIGTCNIKLGKWFKIRRDIPFTDDATLYFQLSFTFFCLK